jgi:hypothetical protein
MGRRAVRGPVPVRSLPTHTHTRSSRSPPDSATQTPTTGQVGRRGWAVAPAPRARGGPAGVLGDPRGPSAVVPRVRASLRAVRLSVPLWVAVGAVVGTPRAPVGVPVPPARSPARGPWRRTDAGPPASRSLPDPKRRSRLVVTCAGRTEAIPLSPTARGDGRGGCVPRQRGGWGGGARAGGGGGGRDRPSPTPARRPAPPSTLV